MSEGTRDFTTSGEMRPVTRPTSRCGGLAATRRLQPRRAKLSGPDRAQASANRGEEPDLPAAGRAKLFVEVGKGQHPVAVGPPQEMMRPQVRGMRHPRRRHQFRQGMQGVAMEVRHPFGLVRHMDRALAQRILRRHAGGTFAGVAALRLDAAHREHEAARGVAPVCPQRQHPGHVEGRGDLAAGPDAHPVTQAHPHQRVVHEGQPVAQRHADMVHELERGGAGAPSFPSTTMKSGVIPVATMALQIAMNSHGWPMHSLKPAGLPPERSRIRAMNSSRPAGVEKQECAAGEFAVLPHRHATDRGDLRRHLGRGQHPAMAGLGTLGKLQPRPCGSAGRPRPRRTWPDRRTRPSPARRNSPTPIPTRGPRRIRGDRATRRLHRCRGRTPPAFAPLFNALIALADSDP